jgi:1,4-alpha-glucan branching enzyme
MGVNGHLAIVLHAHLPFVRHPEHPVFLEENWLFEAMAECYLPLLDMFNRLLDDGVDFRATVSLSPTLCEMFSDPLLRDRFSRRLSSLVELTEKEIIRTTHEPAFNRTARMYRDFFSRIQNLFEEVYHRDLCAAFGELRKTGKLELLVCAATHGFLPLIKHPACARAQVQVGVNNYKKHFGVAPAGMWLPECAYVPGLDAELAAAGVKYFFLDSHGLLFGAPRPKYGTFAPVRCRSGVAAFARDIETSKQVWSAEHGYPGDPQYREFYRDLGYDAPASYIAPYIHPDGIRHDLGIKYHRVTGRIDLAHKEPYNPDAAFAKAEEHAGNFLFNRQAQARHVKDVIKRPPLIIAPYDAELFGHWWFEGPKFLESLFRKAASLQNEIRLVSPSEYLAKNPKLQTIQPSASSWGDKGYFEVWLNGANDWVYRLVHEAEDRMCRLAERCHSPAPLERRALNQAARELLLAESSDWAFILTTHTMTQYAEKRVRTHIARFTELWKMLEAGSINEPRLTEIESLDNLFSEIDYRVYA